MNFLFLSIGNLKDIQEHSLYCDFVREMKIERLGVFAYSREENTPAYDLPEQIEKEVALDRADIIMEQQYRINDEKQEAFMGKTYDVIVDGYDSYSDSYFGRTYMDAPEIDGNIVFTTDGNYEVGDFAEVEVIGVNDYDLIGRDINN